MESIVPALMCFAVGDYGIIRHNSSAWSNMLTVMSDSIYGSGVPAVMCLLGNNGSDYGKIITTTGALGLRCQRYVIYSSWRWGVPVMCLPW
jgi:hypothetical protein